jgi:polyphosphate kinase
MLEVYDRIIGDYLKLSENKNKLLISTGLSQVPYDMVKFYYRLKNHQLFLNKIGIRYLKVLPRMTRDFEITFNNNKDLSDAKNILKNIKSKKNNLKIFNEIEERDRSLFVVLTYPHEVKKNDVIIIDESLEFNFLNELVFVAIKNGMHNTKGFTFCSPDTNFKMPAEPVHISKLHDIILSHF